jgi:heme oxygenase
MLSATIMIKKEFNNSAHYQVTTTVYLGKISLNKNNYIIHFPLAQSWHHHVSHLLQYVFVSGF